MQRLLWCESHKKAEHQQCCLKEILSKGKQDVAEKHRAGLPGSRADQEGPPQRVEETYAKVLHFLIPPFLGGLNLSQQL